MKKQFIGNFISIVAGIILGIQNVAAESVDRTSNSSSSIECSFTTVGGFSNDQIWDIAIDGNDYIYALPPQGGICKSLDHGATWQYQDNAGFFEHRLLAIDNNNNVYVGGSGEPSMGNYLFKTTDGGVSWYNVSEDSTYNLHGLATDTIGQVFTVGVGLNASVNVSRDGGETWEYVEKKATEWIFVDLNNDIYLFYGGPNSHKSTDGGISWNDLTVPYGSFIEVAVDTSNNIFIGDAGSELGLFKSTDGGNHWENILRKCYIQSVAIDKNNNDIYAGILRYSLTGEKKHSLLKSTDGGVTWITTNMPERNINSIAIDGKGHVYVGTNEMGNGVGIGYFFKSTDGGDTWERLGTNP